MSDLKVENLKKLEVEEQAEVIANREIDFEIMKKFDIFCV